MKTNILMALDESKGSMKAVQYVADTFRPADNVTILSVLPDKAAVCKLDSPSLTPLFLKGQQTFCNLQEAKTLSTKEFMEEAKQKLVEAGFSSKNISVKVHKKKLGIPKDILKEAERGKYDTVVVGRRGQSSVKRFLFGSVSNKVLELANKIAVTVVD